MRVDDIPMSRIVDEICAAIASDQRMLVLNVNAHMAMLARRNLWVQDFLDRGDLVFCDGAGIQLASLILNRRGLHRCTPPEWAEHWDAAWRLQPVGILAWGAPMWWRLRRDVLKQ